MHVLDPDGDRRAATAANMFVDLERDGLVVLDGLLGAEDLRHARDTFAAAATRLSWNAQPGFFHTDPYRRMVPDVLRLDEAFVRAATETRVLETCARYVGDQFILPEAKGWRSNATQRDFHGWHNDAWYERSLPATPPQVKLAVYLSDVTSGAFEYRLGSHRKHRPRHWTNEEAAAEGPVRQVMGRAGTAFLFDSSGVHRQATPIATERDAVFLVFHDPTVPLQAEDRVANRYRPLLLDAATLGDLDGEQLRALGVGSRALQRRGYRPPASAPALQRTVEVLTRTHITATRGWQRATARFRARLAT
jgi:hypothetical protein